MHQFMHFSLLTSSVCKYFMATLMTDTLGLLPGESKVLKLLTWLSYYRQYYQKQINTFLWTTLYTKNAFHHQTKLFLHSYQLSHTASTYEINITNIYLQISTLHATDETLQQLSSLWKQTRIRDLVYRVDHSQNCLLLTSKQVNNGKYRTRIQSVISLFPFTHKQQHTQTTDDSLLSLITSLQQPTIQVWLNTTASSDYRK